jgi:hypothetical protein
MVTVREMAWMAMWGIETKSGDRNDAQYSVEKGHLYVLHPLFDLCFVLLASALATLYVTLCLSVSQWRRMLYCIMPPCGQQAGAIDDADVNDVGHDSLLQPAC